MQVELLIAHFPDVFRRHDHRAIARELGQQHRIGRTEMEIDGIGVDHFDTLDGGVVRALRPLGAFLAEQAVEGVLDRIGIEGLAIVEGHALAQMKADLEPVARLLPGFGQRGHEFHVRPAIGQAIEDIRRGRGPVHQKRVDRVPGARVLRRRDDHLAIGESRCDQRAGGQKQRCRRGSERSENGHGSLLCWSPFRGIRSIRCRHQMARRDLAQGKRGGRLSDRMDARGDFPLDERARLAPGRVRHRHGRE